MKKILNEWKKFLINEQGLPSIENKEIQGFMVSSRVREDKLYDGQIFGNPKTMYVSNPRTKAKVNGKVVSFKQGQKIEGVRGVYNKNLVYSQTLRAYFNKSDLIENPQQIGNAQQQAAAATNRQGQKAQQPQELQQQTPKGSTIDLSNTGNTFGLKELEGDLTFKLFNVGEQQYRIVIGSGFIDKEFADQNIKSQLETLGEDIYMVSVAPEISKQKGQIDLQSQQEYQKKFYFNKVTPTVVSKNNDGSLNIIRWDGSKFNKLPTTYRNVVELSKALIQTVDKTYGGPST